MNIQSNWSGLFPTSGTVNAPWRTEPTMRALVTTANGYVCYCREGFDGNPYVVNGCAGEAEASGQFSVPQHHTPNPRTLTYGLIVEGSKSNFYGSSRVKNRLLSLSFVRGSNLFFDYQIGQFIYQTFNLIICMAHLQIMQNMPRVHIKFLTGIHMNSNGTPIQSLLA